MGAEVQRRSRRHRPKPSRWEKRLCLGNREDANLAQTKHAQGGLEGRWETWGMQEVSGDNIPSPELASRPHSPQEQQRSQGEAVFLALLDFTVGSLRTKH